MVKRRIIPELVGIQQIADKLDIPRSTVDSWKRRGELPEPDTFVGEHPLWVWVDLSKVIQREERFVLKPRKQ